MNSKRKEKKRRSFSTFCFIFSQNLYLKFFAKEATHS
jgi:hypothetical protein